MLLFLKPKHPRQYHSFFVSLYQLGQDDNLELLHDILDHINNPSHWRCLNLPGTQTDQSFSSGSSSESSDESSDESPVASAVVSASSSPSDCWACGRLNCPSFKKKFAQTIRELAGLSSDSSSNDEKAEDKASKKDNKIEMPEISSDEKPKEELPEKRRERIQKYTRARFVHPKKLPTRKKLLFKRNYTQSNLDDLFPPGKDTDSDCSDSSCQASDSDQGQPHLRCRHRKLLWKQNVQK
ncbi:unnamed protein product [Sphagnum tenellum]